MSERTRHHRRTCSSFMGFWAAACKTRLLDPHLHTSRMVRLWCYRGADRRLSARVCPGLGLATWDVRSRTRNTERFPRLPLSLQVCSMSVISHITLSGWLSANVGVQSGHWGTVAETGGQRWVAAGLTLPARAEDDFRLLLLENRGNERVWAISPPERSNKGRKRQDA